MPGIESKMPPLKRHISLVQQATEKANCHAECHMGLRPTNRHETIAHLSFPSEARNLLLLVVLRKSRFLVAMLLGMTRRVTFEGAQRSICCFLLKTKESRSLASLRDDIGGAFSAPSRLENGYASHPKLRSGSMFF
jgi:hypothetical protein